jgi:hypothetical protein
MQHIDMAYWLGLIITFVLPLLVGVVTTHVTNSSVQAVILLFLSAANGFLVEYAAPHPDGYSLGSAVVFALVGFVMAVASHFGLWKPTGVARTLQTKVGVTKRSVDLAA